MTSILLSLKSEYIPHIFDIKDKIYELRKTVPNIQPPFNVYVYCCKNYDDKRSFEYTGKVVGQFTVNNIIEIYPEDIQNDTVKFNQVSKLSCVDKKFIDNYSKGKTVFGWEIINPILFKNPLELSQLRKACPQPTCEECSYFKLEIPEWSVSWDSEYVKETIKECLSPRIERAPQSWCYVRTLI